MIGPPAPSEAYMSPPPSTSQNWGVPAAGHGRHQGSAASQAPRPSPLPKDPLETKPGYSASDRLALHKRMQEQDFLPPATLGLGPCIINELEEGEGFSEDDDEDDEEERK